MGRGSQPHSGYWNEMINGDLIIQCHNLQDCTKANIYHYNLKSGTKIEPQQEDQLVNVSF